MKTEDILKLMDKLHETSLRELRIDDKSFSLYLSKNSAPLLDSKVEGIDKSEKINSEVNIEVIENTTKVEDECESIGEEKSTNEVVVKSPLVGIYYEAPSPEAEPFVSVGQKVKKGDVLCIIEAMKIFNEIKSPCDGVVKKIFPSNLEVIEFDQNLMIIGEE